jgi:IS5 family transposase
MIKHKDHQMTFLNPEFACSHLIPEGNYFYRFREAIAPLVKEKDYACMYSEGVGRPAISPTIMNLAVILQNHLNLSDREMEERARYDIRVKYALSLDLDNEGFDHSLLCVHRKRLLENGKEKEIFEKHRNFLVEKGLIKKHEPQRIDASNIIANMAIPSLIGLIKQGIRGVLEALEPELFKKAVTELKLEGYLTKDEVNEYNLSTDEKKRALMDVVIDARALLSMIAEEKLNSSIDEKVKLLEKILNENITGKSKIREIPRKDKPKDRTVSTIDPDARHGAKSNDEKFTGYKFHISESTENSFITNVITTPGNTTDDKPAKELITEQKKDGLKPSHVPADSAYGTGKNIREFKEEGITLVTPPKDKPNKNGLYTIDKFSYDEEKKEVTCPNNVTTSKAAFNKRDESLVFHFAKEECDRCPLRKECTTNPNGRTVTISQYYRELAWQKEYSKTDEYKRHIKTRSPIEPKNAELKIYHGLKRTRYRGLAKVNLQCIFAALAVNIKRFICVTQKLALLDGISAVPVLNTG